MEGSLLGDGCVAQHHEGKNGCRYIESHGIKQLPYLIWKMRKFSNFVVQKEPYEASNEKTYGNTPLYRFWTCLHEDFYPYRQEWYPNNKKIVPENLKLNPLKVAIWHFDDGSINKSRNQIILFSMGFDEHSVEIIAKALYNDLEIVAKIKDKQWKYKEQIRSGKVLVLNAENTRKFIDVTKDFRIPSVEYKLGI